MSKFDNPYLSAHELSETGPVKTENLPPKTSARDFYLTVNSLDGTKTMLGSSIRVNTLGDLLLVCPKSEEVEDQPDILYATVKNLDGTILASGIELEINGDMDGVREYIGLVDPKFNIKILEGSDGIKIFPEQIELSTVPGQKKQFPNESWMDLIKESRDKVAEEVEAQKRYREMTEDNLKRSIQEKMDGPEGEMLRSLINKKLGSESIAEIQKKVEELRMRSKTGSRTDGSVTPETFLIQKIFSDHEKFIDIIKELRMINVMAQFVDKTKAEVVVGPREKYSLGNAENYGSKKLPFDTANIRDRLAFKVLSALVEPRGISGISVEKEMQNIFTSGSFEVGLAYQLMYASQKWDMMGEGDKRAWLEEKFTTSDEACQGGYDFVELMSKNVYIG